MKGGERMEVLILILGITAIVAGIVAVVMTFVKQEEPTSMKVLVPGGICLVSLVLFVILYLL